MNPPPPRPTGSSNEGFDTALVVGIFFGIGTYAAATHQVPIIAPVACFFSDSILGWMPFLSGYRLAPEVLVALLIGAAAFGVTLSLSGGSDPMERHAKKLKARRDREARQGIDGDNFIVK